MKPKNPPTTNHQLMAILNLTPDSFSDGGLYNTPEKAFAQIENLISDGADIIDIGAESTRPGSESITAEEEINRLKPVLKQFKNRFQIPLSIDTTKSQVAQFALDHGADIINDISGLNFDPKMPQTIAKSNATVVLMHTFGKPKTMQNNPTYKNLIQDIKTHLKNSIQTAQKAGIKNIIIDPGIGFGKTTEHNFEIIEKLSEFKSLGYPILVGTSNKSFLGSDVSNRLPQTLKTNQKALQNGASILRVHNIKAHKEILS